MSFAAEPYGVFVDDLVSALTGGVVREEFVFLAENAPFRLGSGVRSRAPSGSTASRNVAFFRFGEATDFAVAADGTITWLARPGVARGRRDLARPRHATSTRATSGRPTRRRRPRLTDRNPGSVVRTLAESFAREYAVLSRQLELVYRGAFLDTAEGRDLDQVVALVGVERRTPDVRVGRGRVLALDARAGRHLHPRGARSSRPREVPAVTVATHRARTLRVRGRCRSRCRCRRSVAGPAGVARGGLAHRDPPADPRHRRRRRNPQALTLRRRRRDRRLAAPARARARSRPRAARRRARSSAR